MATRHFFVEPAPCSEIKVRIVVQYLSARHRVMKDTHKHLGYLDLFCGPGRYDDGTESTPLQVLRGIIADPDLADKVHTEFSDRDASKVERLNREIANLEGIDGLRYRPEVRCSEVDDDLVRLLQRTKRIPSFAFIDPFGYKGVTNRLIGALMKDYGMECMVFCNYQRLNPAVSNEGVRFHVDELLGSERAEQLRLAAKGTTSGCRESLVWGAIVEACSKAGAQYACWFRFCSATQNRTSHYLLFLTNNKLGHKIMKEVMAKQGQKTGDGVPLYVFDPKQAGQGSLDQGLPDLRCSLLERFCGRQKTVKDIIDEHHPNTPYIAANYKQALLAMEKEGEVQVKRRPRAKESQMADHNTVVFPSSQRGNQS